MKPLSDSERSAIKRDAESECCGATVGDTLRLLADYDALADECERLRGLVSEAPPYPPEGYGLPRYGIRWNGPGLPLAVPMDDGYWTPWHLVDNTETLRNALARVEELEAELQSLTVEFKPIPPKLFEDIVSIRALAEENRRRELSQHPERAVVMPEYIREEDGRTSRLDRYDFGWNECLDEFARLNAATRSAIVRVAAEIGRAMK